MNLPILIIQGFSGLLGGITGLVTGEGFIPGFAQGANIFDNVLRAGASLLEGDPGSMLGALLGVSSYHLNAVETGERKLFNSPLESVDTHNPKILSDLDVYNQFQEDALMGFGWGKYSWRDTKEEQDRILTEVGMDLAVSGITALGLQLLSKYGSSLTNLGASSGMAYFLGNQTGKLSAKLDDISDYLEDLQIPGFTSREVDIYGITGDANRFNYQDEETAEDFLERLTTVTVIDTEYIDEDETIEA
jgi:hypothetical protein